MCLTRAPCSIFFLPVRLGPQVYPQQLPGDVQILWVLQRFAEHRIDAFRDRALDIPE